jgi:hypothetical protein
VSGLAAQVAGNAGTAYMMSHGVDPATASVIGTAAGSLVSGVFATIGDWSRGLMAGGIQNPIAQLFVMFGSRIG